MRLGVGHLALLLMALLAMTACGSDSVLDDNNDVAEQEQVQIYFTINMSSSSTRATTWGNLSNDESDEATYNENTIDPTKFQVLVFDTDGNYLDELDNLTYFRHSDSDNGLYDVVGTLSISKDNITNGTLSCKLVVLANYDTKASLTSSSKIDDLKYLTFSYSNHKTENIAAGTAYIPMFGMKTFTDLKMTAGYRTNVGTIYMLRAMAKIRVVLEQDSNGNGTIDEGEDITFEKMTLSKYNSTGYIVPSDFSSVDNTESLSIDVGTFLPKDDETPKTDLSFVKESDTEYYVYVPEYTNNEAKRTQIDIKFDFQKDDDTYTYMVQIAEYSQAAESDYYDVVGDYYNIVRNHVYNFTIIKTKGQLKVTTGNWADIFDNTIEFK